MELTVGSIIPALRSNLTRWVERAAPGAEFCLYAGNLRGKAFLLAEYSGVCWKRTGPAVHTWMLYPIGESDVDRTHVCRIATEHTSEFASFLLSIENSAALQYVPHDGGGFIMRLLDEQKKETQPARVLKAKTVTSFDVPYQLDTRADYEGADIRFNESYGQIMLSSYPGGSIVMELLESGDLAGFLSTLNVLVNAEAFHVNGDEKFVARPKGEIPMADSVDVPPADNKPTPPTAPTPPTGNVVPEGPPEPAAPAPAGTPPVPPAVVPPAPEAEAAGKEPGLTKPAAAPKTKTAPPEDSGVAGDDNGDGGDDNGDDNGDDGDDNTDTEGKTKKKRTRRSPEAMDAEQSARLISRKWLVMPAVEDLAAQGSEKLITQFDASVRVISEYLQSYSSAFAQAVNKLMEAAGTAKKDEALRAKIAALIAEDSTEA